MKKSNKKSNKETSSGKETLIVPDHELFSDTTRLTVMLILYSHQRALVPEIRDLLQVTAGKLDYHITKLQDAGFLSKKVSIFVDRPKAVIKITEQGKKSFKAYIHEMKDILDKIE